MFVMKSQIKFAMFHTSSENMKSRTSTTMPGSEHDAIEPKEGEYIYLYESTNTRKKNEVDKPYYLCYWKPLQFKINPFKAYAISWSFLARHQFPYIPLAGIQIHFC